jgi:phenylpyruvate tautomerase PptA (4-oxalocrotonate tautomerase family)
MPYVHCLTSQTLDPAKEDAFKAGAATVLAEVAGKPENYLFVALQGGQTLYRRGKKDPAAVLRVSLVGKLGGAQKKELSARFCRLCEEALGVPGDGVYIIFEEVAGESWGWNGGTFG